VAKDMRCGGGRGSEARQILGVGDELT